MSEYIIHDSFFESNDKSKEFFYTGKKNVLGIHCPNAHLTNNISTNVRRIGYIMPDTVLSTDKIDIAENFTIIAVSKDRSSYNEIVNASITGSITGNNVSVDLSCKTSTTSDYNIINNQGGYTPLRVVLTKEVKKIDNENKDIVSIWITNNTRFKDIYVNIITSIARNNISINSPAKVNTYETVFLNDSDKMASEDLSHSVTGTSIGQSVNALERIEERLCELERKPISDPQYSIVTYTSNTLINSGNDIKTAQYLIPTGETLQGTESIVKLNISEKGITLRDYGFSLIQIGFDLKADKTYSATKTAKVRLELEIGGQIIYQDMNIERDINNSSDDDIVYTPVCLLSGYISNYTIIRIKVTYINADELTESAGYPIDCNKTTLRIIKLNNIRHMQPS